MTASLERSNSELKLTISSPFRIEFQNTLLTNEARLAKISSVVAGKYSTAASVVGLLSREARPTFRRWSGVVCLLVILVIWTGFYAASASFARRESFRLIVIKLTSDPEPLHWVENGDSIPLNNTEKHAIEEAIGSVRPGALIPISSLKIGKEARTTVVLVMVRDVSDSVRLPRPGRGLVTYVQGQDGSWQGRDANAKGYALRVLPNQETGYTRIEIEGPSGAISTEVGVSHK